MIRAYRIFNFHSSASGLSVSVPLSLCPSVPLSFCPVQPTLPRHGLCLTCQPGALVKVGLNPLVVSLFVPLGFRTFPTHPHKRLQPAPVLAHATMPHSRTTFHRVYS